MTREEAIKKLMELGNTTREWAEKHVDAYAFIMDYKIVE